MKKTIVIIGVSGFIGQALGRFFVAQGHRVKGLTRRPEEAEKLQQNQIEPILWDGHRLDGWEKELAGVDVIIHLSGENIGSGRWTAAQKKRIISSRVETGQLLVQALETLAPKPTLWVQASAVGYYGLHGDKEINEQSGPGQGFLAEVVQQWEASTQPLESLGIQRIVCRFGVVLGKNKGALKQMARPFRFFIGGKIGQGDQWMSWIHIDDVVRGVSFLIHQPNCSGIYNVTAPHPLRNHEFAKILGKVLHRPSVFPTPGFLLKWIWGEMAEELLLSGLPVYPARLLEAGFSFTFPHLNAALQDLF